MRQAFMVKAVLRFGDSADRFGEWQHRFGRAQNRISTPAPSDRLKISANRSTTKIEACFVPRPRSDFQPD